MSPSRQLALALLAAGMLLCMAASAAADPVGASILANSTSGEPGAVAGNRSDARGTITTITIDALQQDQQWKAYVGNVSGRLSLDDADGSTIYDWELAGSIAGEVYVTRHSSIDFDNVSCASTANIASEQSFLNMTGTQSDSINSTYIHTSHAAFFVGTQQIGADSCRSTATYVADSEQTMDGTQRFQALLLQDSSQSLVFATLIDDDATGYDGRTYDFQIIVPESDVNSTSTTYYFFTELSG